MTTSVLAIPPVLDGKMPYVLQTFDLRADAVRMAELAGTEPQAVVIRRLSEHAQSDQELIVTLREVGIVPNARVSVTRKDRGFVVTTPGHDGLELSEEMAHSIFVEKA